jgi:HlyB family type I secretion system ABC transporter
MNQPETQAAQILQGCSPLGQLTEAEAISLVKSGRLVSFPAGSPLLDSKRVSSEIFLLLEGKARLLAPGSVSKDPLSLSLLEPGSSIGWISHLNQFPLEQVTASTACVVLAITAPQFDSWLKGRAALEQSWFLTPTIAEIYDILSRLSVSAPKTPVELRNLAREILPDCRILTGKESEAEKAGLFWFAGGPGTTSPRGAPWEGSGIPEFRVIGLPEKATISHAPDSEPAPDGQEKSGLLGLVSAHRQEYPHIQAKPGLAATLACFAMAAEYHRRPFREVTVRRILATKFSEDQTPDLYTMGAAAEVLGLHAQLISVSRAQMAAADPPGILIWQGNPAVLFEANARRVILVSPVTGQIEIPRSEWEERLPPNSEVLLLKAPELVEQKKFSFRWFIPALKQYKRVLIEVFIASFFVQLFALSNPIVTQVIIDKVLVQNSPGTLHVLGILMLVLAVAGALTTALRTYLFVDTTNRIDLGLGARVVDHLYRLTLGYFQKRPVGEVTSRLHEMENIRSFLTGTALTVVLDGIFSVIYIAIMLFYSVTLTAVALSTIPVLGLITFIIAPIFRIQIRHRAIDNAATQAYLVETLTGIQTVKAQNLEQRSRWEWQERYARYIASSFRVTITSTTFQSLVGLLGKLSDLGVLWFGAYLVIDGKMTLGQLIAFRIIAGYVTNPLLRLIQSWQSFQEVSLSIERLGDVMDSTPEQTEERSRNIPMPTVNGDVSFEDITFRYLPGRPPQLNGVSFSVPVGSFVGVVGESGSGKSTLMKLLPRLYEAESGRVAVDGFDISKVELYSLRRQIATVLQDTLLFDVSVEDNIAVGDPSASPEDIIRAARVAGAHDFIMGLSEGYRTKVGEQGRALSGGQRQRVALARAILQKPRLLILDEATSALDYPTERLVCDNLREEFKGHTVFFVTHRLRSIEEADVIIVMDQGTIAEIGNHTDLMGRRGLYFNLHMHQATT